MTEIVRLISMLIMLFNICNSNDFNRKQCLTDMDLWFWPEIQRAWEIYTEQYTPYQEEHDILKEREASTNQIQSGLGSMSHRYGWWCKSLSYDSGSKDWYSW